MPRKSTLALFERVSALIARFSAGNTKASLSLRQRTAEENPSPPSTRMTYSVILVNRHEGDNKVIGSNCRTWNRILS
jgi:hypothetical protein